MIKWVFLNNSRITQLNEYINDVKLNIILNQSIFVLILQ